MNKKQNPQEKEDKDSDFKSNNSDSNSNAGSESTKTETPKVISVSRGIHRKFIPKTIFSEDYAVSRNYWIFLLYYFEIL